MKARSVRRYPRIYQHKTIKRGEIYTKQDLLEHRELYLETKRAVTKIRHEIKIIEDSIEAHKKRNMVLYDEEDWPFDW